MPKVLVANSHREAYRLRAEHLGLPALADRGTAAETSAVVENLVAVLAPGAGDRVLDIGAGDGQFLARVAARGARGVALDLTPRALARVRQQLGAPESCGFVCGVSEALPFADGQFSIAVINSVMHLLASRAEAASTVAEIYRVLRPGGRAYFGEIPTRDERQGAVESASFGRRLWSKLRRHGPWELVRKFLQRRRDPVWILAPDLCLFWPREEFEALLRGCGFEVREALPHRTLHGLTSRLNYMAVRPEAG